MWFLFPLLQHPFTHLWIAPSIVNSAKGFLAKGTATFINGPTNLSNKKSKKSTWLTDFRQLSFIKRVTRALVLLVPLLALDSRSTSLSAGIHVWIQAVWYDFLYFWVFLPSFCTLIFSLPLLRLGCKSTSLSSGFCVHQPRHCNMICWKLDLISGFFVFSLIVLGNMADA